MQAPNAETPLTGRLPEEAAELIADAEGRGIGARLLGGIGILLRLGNRLDPMFERSYGDIDFICGSRDSRAVEVLLAERGWQPATEFNALNGARRLLFHDPAGPAQVDVFVGEFSMCHELPLADSLDEPGPALPAGDLLLSKLQIVEINAKDRGDIFALLAGCDPDSPRLAIDFDRIGAIVGRDWGLHHTLELNVAKLREGLAAGEAPPHAEVALERLADVLESAPKSRSWKLRARIGERKRWYDLPEEVDRD